MSKPQNLEDYIEKSGYKISFIQNKLGISHSAFAKKRNGKTPFRQSEIYVLVDLLKIPQEQVESIFFA